MREYVVTTRRGIDIAEIDFELYSEQGSDTVPHRTVDLANPRVGSRRNTHWWLTDEEADNLRKDPRILDVDLSLDEQSDLEIVFDGYSKSPHENPGDSNWGLVRCSHRKDPLDYSCVDIGLNGTGVDIVIQDTGIQVDHPEFLDAEGVSRIRQIDWFKEAGISGTQHKNHYTDTDGHGTHVASTAAGLYYGWAKNASIYSQKLAGDEGYSYMDAFDAIKLWHRNKPVKRPTIVNMSWSIKRKCSNPFVYGDYQGERWDFKELAEKHPRTYRKIIAEQYKIATLNQFPGIVFYITADIEEMIDEGIHICHSAGNDSAYIVDEWDENYDNAIYYEFAGKHHKPIYYNRPSSPHHPDAITVGSSSINDNISRFSRTGSAVDIFAPGEYIIGSVPNTVRRFRYRYPLNEKYRSAVLMGTSMSTPQVTGVAALHLQANPYLTPQQLKSRLLADSTSTENLNLLYNRYNGSSFIMKG